MRRWRDFGREEACRSPSSRGVVAQGLGEEGYRGKRGSEGKKSLASCIRDSEVNCGPDNRKINEVFGWNCDTSAQGLIGLIQYSYQKFASSFLEAGLQRTPRLSVLDPEQFGDE